VSTIRRAIRPAAAIAGVLVLIAGAVVLLDRARPVAPPAGHGSASGAAAPAARTVPVPRHASMPTALEDMRMELGHSASLPADCIPESEGPPSEHYQLGIVGMVNDGVLTAGTATVADITAKFCGVVTVVPGKPPCGATGNVNSPQDGQLFGSISATLTLIPGLSPKVPFVAHPGTITGGFGCGSSADGLAFNLTAVVSGSTGIFGLSCTIGPLTIPLSGVLTGPLSDSTATLRSNDFAVPAVSASPTCAGQVPGSLDAIAALPIPAGGASISLPVTASLYQPAPKG
jgi:hypothetical protein